MKKLLTTTLLAAMVLLVHSQSVILQKINNIKKQSDIYFYDQYAHADPEIARTNVVKWVLLSINEGRSESEEVRYEDIVNKVQHLVMTSGGVTRDFAYIKKSDVPGVGIDTPMSDSTPILNSSSSPTPIQETKQMPTPVPTSDRFVPDMFVQRIMEQKKFQSVHRYLRALKADGQVRMFGPLSQVADDYSSLDLILFDKTSEEIITLLSGVNASGVRINLTTGKADSLDNYPEDMVAVIWYIKD